MTRRGVRGREARVGCGRRAIWEDPWRRRIASKAFVLLRDALVIPASRFVAPQPCPGIAAAADGAVIVRIIMLLVIATVGMKWRDESWRHQTASRREGGGATRPS